MDEQHWLSEVVQAEMAVRAAEQDLDDARSRRAQAVRDANDHGVSQYRIARELGRQPARVAEWARRDVP